MKQQKFNLAKFAMITSLIASAMSIAWISYNAWIAYQASKLTEKNHATATDKV